jgi:hypothetical protein
VAGGRAGQRGARRDPLLGPRLGRAVGEQRLRDGLGGGHSEGGPEPPVGPFLSCRRLGESSERGGSLRSEVRALRLYSCIAVLGPLNRKSVGRSRHAQARTGPRGCGGARLSACSAEHGCSFPTAGVTCKLRRAAREQLPRPLQGSCHWPRHRSRATSAHAKRFKSSESTASTPGARPFNGPAGSSPP